MLPASDPTAEIIRTAIAGLDRDEIVATCVRSHLGGRYWDEHALTLRPELEFCGSDGAHGMLQDFQDTLPPEGRKDDFWEWDGTDRYFAYVTAWAEARFEVCLDRLLDIMRSGGSIPISRMMVVAEDRSAQLREAVGSQVDVIHVGVFWAAGDGATSVYFPAGDGDREIGLSAEVELDAIDLRMTLLARMDYQNGDEEGEIRLRPAAHVTLVAVEDYGPAPSAPAFAA